MTLWGQVANTRIMCDLPGLVFDRFDRTETDSWGDATKGGSWTITGTAAGWDVIPGTATIVDVAGDGEFAAVDGVTVTDADVIIALAVSADGGDCFVGATVRTGADPSQNCYEFAIGNDESIAVGKYVGGVYTELATTPFAVTAGAVYLVRGQVEGSALRMRAWPADDPEPAGWLLEAADTSHASGGVGVSHVGAATEVVQFYGFEALRHDLVDISDYALTVGNLGQNIEAARGRQTELSGMDPSRMSLRLNNMDGRFTPGNVSGAYWPYWKQGRRIVWTETIQHETFTLFDGFLEIPEVQLTFEAAEDPTLTDRTVSVAAVDRLTWLDRARPFVSTLAAHILGSVRNGCLKHYWPMGSQRGNAFDNVVDPSTPVFIQKLYDSAETGRTVEVSSTPVGPGDDLPDTLSIEEAEGNHYVTLFANSVAALPAGQALTVVGWLAPSDPDPAASSATVIRAYLTETGPSDIGLISIGPAAGIWGADVFGGAISSTIVQGTTYGNDAPVSVAARYTVDEFEFWFNDEQEVGSVAGSAPGTTILTQLDLAEDFFGRLTHVQVYVGDPDDFTFEDYQIQRDVGLHGLERQTTGDRIRTIAAYAGIPESALDATDDGSSVMQAAELAGKTAAQAMQEADATERGRLFTTGDGQFAFHGRNRIYNA